MEATKVIAAEYYKVLDYEQNGALSTEERTTSEYNIKSLAIPKPACMVPLLRYRRYNRLDIKKRHALTGPAWATTVVRRP